jgi:hypothetical protein
MYGSALHSDELSDRWEPATRTSRWQPLVSVGSVIPSSIQCFYNDPLQAQSFNVPIATRFNTSLEAHSLMTKANEVIGGNFVNQPLMVGNYFGNPYSYPRPQTGIFIYSASEHEATLGTLYSSQEQSLGTLSAPMLKIEKSEAQVDWYSENGLRPLETTIFQGLAKLRPLLRNSTQQSLLSLRSSLAEEGEPGLEVESVKAALEFLAEADPVIPPSFSVGASNEVYLQWRNQRFSLLGITFKRKELCVWTLLKPSEKTAAKVVASAGTCELADLVQLTRLLAPWVHVGKVLAGSLSSAA